MGAVDPNGQPAPFSTSNDGVTLSAPGAGSVEDCGDGVFSTIPQQATLWSDGGCLRTVSGTTASAGRYGYAEGTSFAAQVIDFAGGRSAGGVTDNIFSAINTPSIYTNVHISNISSSGQSPHLPNQNQAWAALPKECR